MEDSGNRYYYEYDNQNGKFVKSTINTGNNFISKRSSGSSSPPRHPNSVSSSASAEAVASIASLAVHKMRSNSQYRPLIQQDQTQQKQNPTSSSSTSMSSYSSPLSSSPPSHSSSLLLTKHRMSFVRPPNLLETERQPLIETTTPTTDDETFVAGSSGGSGSSPNGVADSSYSTGPIVWPSLNYDEDEDDEDSYTSTSSSSQSTLRTNNSAQVILNGPIKIASKKNYSDNYRKNRKMLSELQKKTSNLQTLMHILKGNIGTGILAMPNAFLHSGLIVGTVMLPIFAILCTHCMHILVKSNGILTKRLGVGMLEYQEVMEYSLTIGPKCVQKYSRTGSFVIKFFLMVTQLGFCCVYSLFVAENLAKVISEFTSNEFNPRTAFVLAMLLPFFIMLSFVKSLKHLSIASSIANLFQSVGLVIVLINLFQNLPTTNTSEFYGPLRSFPLFMGTAIYAFEGIGLILPLQKEMKKPNSLGGSVGVLNTGMTVVACINVAIGFFGYYKFGDQIMGSITLNLPAEPLYQYCKIIFASAIFLSYSIQYYVPIQIIWPWAQQKYHLKEQSSRTTMIEYCVRALLVTFTLALAAAIPKLDLFISLVGALSSSCLALIFPPFIDICCRWNEDTGFFTWSWIFTKNLSILCLGILAFTTGTYASIESIVKNFQMEDSAL